MKITGIDLRDQLDDFEVEIVCGRADEVKCK
jgi:hypothetical protein